MSLNLLKGYIKEVKLGEFEGDFLRALFKNDKISDFYPRTKNLLGVTKMESKASVGDLVIFRSYSKGSPNMDIRSGVVIKKNSKSFTYLAKVKGKVLKIESTYCYLKNDGMALLGFIPVYKKELETININN